MFFEKYEFFLEIADQGSITKAAEKLLISQSALSKYLHRLEESLGTKLFDRKTLPLKLTKAGEVFYRYVVQSIDMEKKCLLQIKSMQDTVGETLRIGIGPWRASCFLPKVLPLFQERYPYIKIEVVEGVSDALADAMQKNKVDLCILGASNSYPFLESIPLCDEKILLVGSNSHPLVKQIRMEHPAYGGYINTDIRLFYRERIILTSERQRFSQILENYFARVNFHPSDIIRIENLQTGLYMTAQGNYFSFVPEIATHSIALPENISFFTVGLPELIFPIALTYNKSTVLSHSARLFMETVLAYYRNYNKRTDISLPHTF